MGCLEVTVTVLRHLRSSKFTYQALKQSAYIGEDLDGG